MVTLITGDVVSVTTGPDGRQTASILRANPQGPGGAFQTFNDGSDLYVVPESAVPYLGSTLDLSLFDVTHPADGVRVTYRAGAPRPRLPGGAAFGAALAAQWRRDHAAAEHGTGLFADVARISSASAPSPRVRPDFPMRTLTIHGIDEAGKPDTGDLVEITNVDHRKEGTDTPVFMNGVVKVSVPTGRYVIQAFFYDSSTDTVRLVTTPVRVRAGSAGRASTVDARTATTPVTVTTPTPSAPAIKELDIGVGGDNQSPYTFVDTTYTLDGAGSIFVKPQPRPIGYERLQYYVYQRSFGTRATYDLEFPSTGVIPASEHYVARKRDLAAVASAYPASQPDTAAVDAHYAAAPWQAFIPAVSVALTTPLQRTEYYSAPAQTAWRDQYWPEEDLGPAGSSYENAWTHYQPGEKLSTTWGGALGHPNLLQGPLIPGTAYCPACLGSDKQLHLLVYPYGDNDPQHIGFVNYFPASGFSEAISYGVYADYVPLQSGSSTLDTAVPVPAGTQTYRIDYDVARSSPDLQLSTDVRTRWTVPASAPASALPAGWACTYYPNPPASCRVLPLISGTYRLPVNLLGQLPAGEKTTGRIDLTHLAGAPIGFRKVKVAVSFNGGQSWRAVTTTDEGTGHYALSFTVPTTTAFGAVRVTATDNYGGTFMQTIQHAFVVGN